MTYRQIQARTGLSLGLISQVINEMINDGTIKVFLIKKTIRKYNDMVFYYFVDIFEAMVKEKAFKIVKKKIEIINLKRKMNTRNINYINKLSYKRFLNEIYKKQLHDFSNCWNFIEGKWERVVKSNFKFKKNELEELRAATWAILNKEEPKKESKKSNYSSLRKKYFSKNSTFNINEFSSLKNKMVYGESDELPF